jgi:hypothetical protein
MMTCHSNLIYRVFLADYGGKKHYFVCIYTQKADVNNRLVNDIYGVLLTTSNKTKKVYQKHNDYNVSLLYNKRETYARCDILARFDLEKVIFKDKIEKKYGLEIEEKVRKFIDVIKKQLRRNLK